MNETKKAGQAKEKEILMLKKLVISGTKSASKNIKKKVMQKAMKKAMKAVTKKVMKAMK